VQRFVSAVSSERTMPMREMVHRRPGTLAWSVQRKYLNLLTESPMAQTGSHDVKNRLPRTMPTVEQVQPIETRNTTSPSTAKGGIPPKPTPPRNQRASSQS
jgi:hypothetical protein